MTEMLFSTRKAPVGCKRDAEMAARDELDFVDKGLFKRVYVNASRTVVYKVARGASRGGRPGVDSGRETAIVAEVAWVAKGRSLGTPGMPHVTLWLVNGEPVEAMPFYPYPGDDPYELGGHRYAAQSLADRYRRDWYALGMEDLHNGNFRYTKGFKPVVVDLGGWGHGFPSDSLPVSVRDVRTDVYSNVEDECDSFCDCGDCMASGTYHSMCDNCGEYSNECCCGLCTRDGHYNCNECGYCWNCEYDQHQEACAPVRKYAMEAA